ncbi:hypothetical protein QBC41DRAFT_310958 [Cercophora samala]|uniref:Uncharacterized protein n=1 Tax=Cercophora samala TaxID=330535 RepID=A0AA39ZN52_9PEZI|nr:hypothetical protein QBC41DRAFT_310958 [Cercophora samala]
MKHQKGVITSTTNVVAEILLILPPPPQPSACVAVVKKSPPRSLNCLCIRTGVSSQTFIATSLPRLSWSYGIKWSPENMGSSRSVPPSLRIRRRRVHLPAWAAALFHPPPESLIQKKETGSSIWIAAARSETQKRKKRVVDATKARLPFPPSRKSTKDAASSGCHRTMTSTLSFRTEHHNLTGPCPFGDRGLLVRAFCGEHQTTVTKCCTVLSRSPNAAFTLVVYQGAPILPSGYRRTGSVGQRRRAKSLFSHQNLPESRVRMYQKQGSF